MELYRIQSNIGMSSAGVILSAKLSDEVHKKESGVVSKQDVSISCATVRCSESADMKMGEYKRYIYDKISELPVHPTQLNRSASVFISEDGFAAMKDDPEYEEWVIGKLREDFAICNPISQMHGSYVIYQFGAKKSEYRGDSWYAEFQNGNGKQIYKERSRGNFWSTHAAEQKEILEAHNEYVRDKKRRELELMQQDASKSNPVLIPDIHQCHLLQNLMMLI